MLNTGSLLLQSNTDYLLLFLSLIIYFLLKNKLGTAILSASAF